TAVAGVAVSGLTDFVATFKDNPGRRLYSVLLGVVIGVLVAAVFGLDLFAAIQSAPVAAGAPAVKSGSLFDPLPSLGIAVTGLVMGLGSNPTHEVIRAIQEFKKAKKAENRQSVP